MAVLIRTLDDAVEALLRGDAHECLVCGGQVEVLEERVECPVCGSVLVGTPEVADDQLALL